MQSDEKDILEKCLGRKVRKFNILTEDQLLMFANTIGEQTSANIWKKANKYITSSKSILQQEFTDNLTKQVLSPNHLRSYFYNKVTTNLDDLFTTPVIGVKEK